MLRVTDREYTVRLTCHLSAIGNRHILKCKTESFVKEKKKRREKGCNLQQLFFLVKLASSEVNQQSLPVCRRYGHFHFRDSHLCHHVVKEVKAIMGFFAGTK